MVDFERGGAVPIFGQKSEEKNVCIQYILNVIISTKNNLHNVYLYAFWFQAYRKFHIYGGGECSQIWLAQNRKSSTPTASSVMISEWSLIK